MRNSLLGGRKRDALSLWERSLEVLQGELSDEHPLMQTLRVNIAVTMIDFKEAERGADLLRSVWRTRTDLYGEDDERTLKTQYELARALFVAREYDEARALAD